MRLVAVPGLVFLMTAVAVAATGGDETAEIVHDVSTREPAASHDFNVSLLTNLGKPVRLDVTVAADNFRRGGWLVSTYYIAPDELRGIELRVPQSAILVEGADRFRVRGLFRLSEVMSHRQGQISLHLLPLD